MDSQTNQIPDMRAGPVSQHTLLLKRSLDQALEAMKKSEHVSTEGALLFFGNPHDAIPRLLITDPVLDSDEVRAWQLIRIYVSDPASPASFPKQEELAGYMNISRPVVSRCIQVLRVTRWLTQCTRVRSSKGRFRQSVYGLHDEPLNLADTLFLDPEYLGFLDHCQSSNIKRVREIAERVLDNTSELAREGFDITRSHGQLERIALRHNALVINRNSNLITPPGKESLHGDSPCHQSLHGENTTEKAPANDFSAGEKPRNDAGFSHVKNIDAGISTESLPRKESLHGDFVSSLFACTRGSSSCSSNTTTTTNHEEKEKPLTFPKQLNDSERRLATHVLQELPVSELRQYALDFLSDRMEAGEKGADTKVRNPVGFLKKIITRMLEGTLHPSSYGLSDKSNTRSISLEEQAIRKSEEEQRAKDDWIRQMRSYGMEVDEKTGALRKIEC